MERIYKKLVLDHLQQFRQMVFLAGPRQVGKTTISLNLESGKVKNFYFNWDIKEDREKLVSGPKRVGDEIGLKQLKAAKTLIVFDEIHKYPKWKQFLKGFFDLYENCCKIVVTGSAKLNIFKRHGDSLMGRYFLYRIHPLSVGELLSTKIRKKELQPPRKLPELILQKLFDHGGFPEPFLHGSGRFTQNWQRLRQEQLVREDIRDISQVHNLAQFDILTELLKREAASLVQYKSLANQVDVSEPTIKRWIRSLEQVYYCFRLRPWSKNIRSSLRKEPKFYLWDWSLVNDHGARVENFIAAHLYKSVHYWTDFGMGNYELFYLRDKLKREVDFLVTKDNKPWFIVEAKASNNKGITKSLHYFYKQLQVPHAFQVVYDLPYENVDCFSQEEPVIVPARTFLSQLI